MPRSNILMLVRNSVTRDARVLKTANSLQKKGYQVNIIGVIENQDDFASEDLESGVKITRLPFRSALHKLFLKFYFLLLAFLSLFLFWFQSFSQADNSILFQIHNSLSFLIKSYSSYFLSIVLILFLLRKIIVHLKFYQNYRISNSANDMSPLKSKFSKFKKILKMLIDYFPPELIIKIKRVLFK